MTLHARYTILRKIADGGTAEIFLATQHGAHGFEKPVVLKRIFPAFYADPQFRNMLVDEAHIAMSLNHSNIVQVLDLGEADGQYVLALELVDGWTLDAVLRRARALTTTMPPALALYMAAEICRALAYAHAKTGADDKPLGIVHRDISPHNVLLSEQGEVKLTDFGIAKARNRRESSLGNIIKGKIAYMSPEQASGGELDARSDLFSVGTLLYVMICGRYPFDAATDLEVLLLVKNGECLPPEKARPGLNPEIYRVLKRAMAKSPAERYQRADEMLVDFEQVMRIAFRAVGQTELKRWLQDLSMRDGVLPLTRAAAASATAGRLAGETLELRGIDPTALPISHATLPPPAAGSRPNRPPPPAPQPGSGGSGGRGGSGPGARPPPPPAAMAVGRKGAPPPSPSGPIHGPPHTPAPAKIVDHAADSVTPKPTAKSAEKPAAKAGTPPTARPTAPPLHPSKEGPVERATPKVAIDAVTEKAGAADGAGPSTGTERITAKMAVLDPPPPTPRKSSSWVAEAVAAAAQRAGTAPPPPLPTMVVAPPMILPVPHVTGDVKAPPVPTETPRSQKQRRLVIGASVGIGALLVIVLSVKTCGGKPDDPQAANLGPAKNVGPAHVASADPAPPVAVPIQPPPAASAPDAVAPKAEASIAPPVVNPPVAAPAEPPTTPPVAAPAAPPPAPPVAAPAAPPPTPPVAAEAVVAAESGTPGVRKEADPSPATGRPAATSADPVSADPDPKSDGENDGPATATAPRVSVLLRSSPPGAQVGTPHHPFGSTPISVKLKAGQTYALVFSREGYRPVTRQIRVTDEAGQQLFATLKPAPPPPKPTPAPAASPPTPPPPAKPAADKSWFQRMFAR